MNNNKDFISHEVHLPSDPSINILNQNIKHKQSLKKQKQQKNKKFSFKIILWICGLISLNALSQILNYYYNYNNKFEFNWTIFILVSLLYCIFSLIFLGSSNIKTPEMIDNIKKEAKQKRIEELKKQAEQDKQANLPKCPTCGSTNIRHISSAERGVNAVMFGFFGNKRKCQFECLNPNCRYRW